MDLLEWLLGYRLRGAERPWRRRIDAALFCLVAVAALGTLAYLLWS